MVELVVTGMDSHLLSQAPDSTSLPPLEKDLDTPSSKCLEALVPSLD